MIANQPEGRPRLQFLERAGYAAGDLGCSMYWVLFAQYLMYFYTDVVGIGAAAIATMFAITRLWDTAIDPVMGLIADRTRSRHGRYRPWLLWSIVPLLAFSLLTFTVPKLSGRAELLYVYATYTLTEASACKVTMRLRSGQSAAKVSRLQLITADADGVSEIADLPADAWQFSVKTGELVLHLPAFTYNAMIFID